MWIGIASARCDFSPPQKGPRTAPLHDNGLKTNFGKNKGKTLFISQSEPKGELWLLLTRRWLARGLRPGILSEIHLAFLPPPNSQARFGSGRACHGKRVLHCGSPGLGQLRCLRQLTLWHPCESSDYLITLPRVR